MKKRYKLKKWVKVVLTIVALILLHKVIIPAIKASIERDRQAIAHCVAVTGNEKLCIDEYFG